MMEHTTDRLFWTLSAIIIGALILTLSAKAFPKATQSVIAPMSGLVKQADNATSASVTNAINADTNSDNGYTPEQGLTPVTNTTGPTDNSSANNSQTQAQIDALNQKNQSLTNQLNNQSNQLISFNNQVSTLQNQNQVFTTQLQTFQNNLAAQQAQNDQLNTQLQNALNAAAAQKTIDEQTIATITKQNQDLYQQVQDANNKAAESAGNYTADINRLTNQLQVLQNNYASMAGLGKNVDDINKQIINVVKQIQAAQAGQQSLASTISNMNSTAQQQFANYQSQLNLSNQTISDLANKVKSNNDLITSLQQQLNAANNAIANLQNGVKNAQQTADNANNTANNANNTANNAQNIANNANNAANSALSQAQQAINAVNNTLQFRGEWQGEYWDWNTHQDGIYSVDRGPGQNFLPSGFSGWGQLTLTTSGGGNDRFAELKDNVGHIFYQHQFGGSGSWSGWIEMATKDDVNNAQNTANNANNTANNANNTANNAQNTANWAGGVANNAQNTANNAQNTANAANWRANNSLYIGQTLGGGTRIRDIQGSGVYFLDGSWYLGLPGGRDGNVWGQLVVYNGGGVVNQILYDNHGQIWRRSINSWGTTSWDQV